MRVLLVGLTVLALALLAGPTATQSAVAQGRNTLCVVYDIGGRGDLSFNDMAALGADRAKSELKLATIEVQSSTEADYLPNLRGLARGGQCLVIVGVGFLLADAITTVAGEFPDQLFAGIDTGVAGKANVLNVNFNAHEGSALVGALGALIAQKFNAPAIGVVLGIEIPVLWEFEIGYKWGIRWAENGFDSKFDQKATITKNLNILFNYTGTFTDPAKGRTATEAMLAQGANVVYNVAGGTGIGIFQAVEAAGKAKGQTQGPPFGVGVDAAQDYIAAGYIITSMMKRVDVGVFTAAKLAKEGKFRDEVRRLNGFLRLGLGEGGIALSTVEDVDQFMVLGVAAGTVKASDRDRIVTAIKALRAQYTAEFARVATLEAAIKSGAAVIPLASTQDAVNAGRRKFDK